ncbi:MAG TPA: rod shape-determining protein MreD [Sphingomicrobium sp.]|jgi:rod shape-determining protein MreD|nr:rod shape-determining protein MreD [Sphingomicrobium sp.]
MVRAALASKRRIGQGPRPAAAYVPAISVLAASYLSALPIVSQTGWWPDFGFLVLIAWRLLRADAWPAWWAAPLGLAHDLLTGSPIGLSVALWTAAMLALDMADRRTMWRDYWLEWALAAVLLFASETAEWRVADWMGASFPFVSIVPPLLISIFAFPVAAWLVGRIDAWRLGR